MSISKRDKQKMIRLAQEGKQISDIMKEDFPEWGYDEIYVEVYGGGQRAARGIKVAITNRLNKLVDSTKIDRRSIVKELNDLVWHLYNNHKTNQKKIKKIRDALK